MIRPLLLLLAAYGALLAHRAYLREEAVPLPLGEASPRARIREELAQESAVEGPLTKAFETLYERRRAQAGEDEQAAARAAAPDPGPFAFLLDEGDSQAVFLEKLAAYAASDDARRSGTQAEILEYALSRPERGTDALTRIALAALGQVELPETGEPNDEARRIFGLSAALLARNARDAYELERVKQELMASRPEDGFATALDEAFASATE